MTDILVGVDGSPASIGALTMAGGLAERWGGRLVVAVAVGPEAGGDQPDGVRPAAVDRWCEEAVLARSHEALVLVGDPANALHQAAAERGVGLVVVGTEGTLGRSGPRLGSVAHALAHRVDVRSWRCPCAAGGGACTRWSSAWTGPRERRPRSPSWPPCPGSMRPR